MNGLLLQPQVAACLEVCQRPVGVFVHPSPSDTSTGPPDGDHHSSRFSHFCPVNAVNVSRMRSRFNSSATGPKPPASFQGPNFEAALFFPEIVLDMEECHIPTSFAALSSRRVVRHDRHLNAIFWLLFPLRKWIDTTCGHTIRLCRTLCTMDCLWRNVQ